MDLDKSNLQYLLNNFEKGDVCKELEISSRTLDRLISKFNLTRNNFGRKNLTLETVNSIRTTYNFGSITQKQLADMFKISQSLVSKILNNISHRSLSHLKVSGEAKVRKG